MLGPDPCTAQPLVQPPEALHEKNDRAVLALNWNVGGGSVAEEVAALPFAGDAFLLQRLQPGTQDQLSQILRGPVLGQAFAGGLPAGREQADYHLAPLIGPKQGLLPPLTRRNTRHWIKIQENLVGKTGVLLHQPPLQCDGLRGVPARMTQKDA